MAERVYARHWHAAKDAQAWRVLPEGAYAYFRTSSFKESVAFVGAIGALVGANDAPYIDIRDDGVTVLMRAFRAEYGLFQADFELARAISAKAAEMGLTAEPSGIQSLSMIPGATKRGQIMPFWQAVLAYQPRPDSPDEDLVDPRGRGPGIWFEQVESLNEMRPRMHFGVWVPIGDAEARVEATIAAGGRVIYERAPSWWTLADPEGNEADIATVENRG